MRSGLVVVADVFVEDLSEMILTKDDQMVQAFPPDRSDDFLGVRVLPGGLRGSDDLLDAQPCHPVTEPIAVDGVTISEQISGLGSFSRERFDDLLRGPLRRGMTGDVEVENAPAVVADDEEAIQKVKSHGGYSK